MGGAVVWEKKKMLVVGGMTVNRTINYNIAVVKMIINESKVMMVVNITIHVDEYADAGHHFY